MTTDQRGADPAVLARLLRRRLASTDGWTISAVGPSMQPGITPGSTLRVVACDRPPRIGEVWAFVNASNLVTAHRYLRRTRRGRYVFFGDSTERADDPIRHDWLVGLVVEVHDTGGVLRLRRRRAVRPVAAALVRGGRRRVRGLFDRAE